MTFMVMDYGQRVQTPWYDIFPPRHVQRRAKTSATKEISERDQLIKSGIPESEQEQKQEPSSGIKTYQKIEEGEQKRQPVSLAVEVMSSDVVTLSANINIETAWKLFRQHGFRHIPIVDNNSELVGLISDRDILSSTSNLDTSTNKATLAQAVSDIMTTQVLVANPTTPIRLLANAMTEYHIGAIPLIDDDKQLVGIVTRGDILSTLMHQVPIELWS